MACDTRLKPRQTAAQREMEVRKAKEAIAAAVAAGTVKPVVDKRTGAVAFAGVSDEMRDGVTDACVYRMIMSTGSALARAQIAKAEQIAGRTVNRQAVAQGHHSHDGGKTWHSGH